MIAVIADDLTGAAEIGGIGLRYGLNTVIISGADSIERAGLLVVATDTRSVSQEEAIRETETAAWEIARCNPDMIFKKVDSVLRGHVLPEITALMKVFGMKRTLLVPANPAQGRTIKDGIYYVHGKRIDTTAFAADPEFPVRSADVLAMLRAERTGNVSVKRYQDELPSRGIIAGEAERQEDLARWAMAGLAGGGMLLAGAAGFFTALLDRYPADKAHAGNGPVQHPVSLSGNRLYIGGSTFDKEFVRAVLAKGGHVSYIPVSLPEEGGTEERLFRWTEQICGQLKERGYAVVAIDGATAEKTQVSASSLRSIMGLAVKRVLDHTPVGELLISGGSTARAILRGLRIETLFPVNELAPGVIRCSTKEKKNLYITLKPGSYDWPEAVRTF